MDLPQIDITQGLIFFFLFSILCCGCSACMIVCYINTQCLGPGEGTRSPGTVVTTPMWVLRITLGSSGRTAIALNHWVIYLSDPLDYFFNISQHKQYKPFFSYHLPNLMVLLPTSLFPIFSHTVQSVNNSPLVSILSQGIPTPEAFHFIQFLGVCSHNYPCCPKLWTVSPRVSGWEPLCI